MLWQSSLTQAQSGALCLPQRKDMQMGLNAAVLSNCQHQTYELFEAFESLDSAFLLNLYS